jgi:hypothetical protein
VYGNDNIWTHRKNTMTLAKNSLELTKEEWKELVALKESINYSPASVHPDKMERFTELLVKSWEPNNENKKVSV